MKIKLFGLLLLLMMALAACNSSDDAGSSNDSSDGETPAEETSETEPAEEAEPLTEEDLPQLSNEASENEPVVEMTTNKGVITIKLFPDYAPKTVENFLTHSKDGYYDGVTFHRVMNEFMIQGGDPEGTGMGGESIYDGPFEDEFAAELFHLRGALSMANSGPNTNGSQFFIVQNSELQDGVAEQMEAAGFQDVIMDAYKEMGGTPHLDGGHTVFGQVIEGMDVVDEIAAVEVDEASKPADDVIIESIEVIQE